MRDGGWHYRAGALATAMACGLLAAWAAGLAGASPAAADPGDRYRRLDAGERARAIEQARGRASAALAARASRSAGEDFRSEVLLVERHRGGKAPELAARRLADVYVYDYDADRLSRSVVDLDAGDVLSVRVVEGAQPPLTAAEVQRALALVFTDAELAARIRADYTRVSGRALVDPDALRVSGFVFRADSMPGARDGAAAVCGRHRCAQLLIRTPDEVALQLPVVDLSRERVLGSHSFGTPRAGAPAPEAAAAPPAGAPPPHAHPEHSHDHAH